MGMLGAIAGTTVIWLSSLLGEVLDVEGLSSATGMLGIITAGLGGMLIDSLLGASVQAQYLDPDTGGAMERASGPSMPLAHGWRWVHNDAVNLACTLSGAVFAMVCLILQQG